MPTRVIKHLVAIATVIAMIACPGCTPPEQATHSRFVELSHGWASGTPLHIRPEMPDSNAAYTLQLAIRNTNTFAYDTLPLTVDLIDTLHHPTRLQINIPVVDKNGNRLGTGFGTLYQHRVELARDINPRALSQIVVWHDIAMPEGKTLHGITEIGVFAKPE